MYAYMQHISVDTVPLNFSYPVLVFMLCVRGIWLDGIAG
jgi:hypothetical protein